FTHRTFMEYFAAFQLVRRCGTPEELAKTLLPRIAVGEWDVVAQLSVQIVNKTAENGADRFFETVLAKQHQHGETSQVDILRFTLRCLDIVAVKPSIIRQATRTAVLLIIADGRSESVVDQRI